MKKPLKIILPVLAVLALLGCSTLLLPVSVPTIIYLDKIASTTELAVEDGTTLIMNGEVNSKTPEQIRDAFMQYPGIKTIRMGVVPGSLNDDANLAIAQFVAGKKVTMIAGRYSLIASGGVDFFLAGENRIVEEGAQFGVHSWGGLFGETATKYPRDHEYHQPYIEYYQAVGLSRADAEKFYFFTINAAPAGDIHVMSEDELIEYKITTSGITAPAYISRGQEAQRKREGLPHITDAEARRRGIAIRD